MSKDQWLHKNGKPVKMIYFATRDEGVCPYISANDERKLILHVEYMGDRTESWIAAIEAGKETARYNVRCLETIVWDESSSTEAKG